VSAVASETGHILVVDDNEMNRDMLSRRLLRQGHTVDMAEDGREALGKLETGDYDLVLLDIMMPVMNGFELLERLRAAERFRHLPVVMISALDDADSVTRAIGMGADDHLPKPFNPQILRARVGASLARKRLRDREQMHARALEREIDIAREIQAGFLPSDLPRADGWELAACFEPARQVGGDFYDAFALGDGRIALVVADVCDKGVGAALFMALFRSLLRAGAERTLAGREALPAQLPALLSSTNDYIARTHDGANMFATMFVGVLDPAEGRLGYVNAGHEAPAIAGADRVRARLAPTGPAVGMMPGMAFGFAEETVAPGETLLMFTDGVTDARDPSGVLFEEQRLLPLLPGASGAGRLVRSVRDAVHAHAAGKAPFDDLTMLAVSRAAA
jgi:serine phosphatase RsbU (regulator of sigma subunit)